MSWNLPVWKELYVLREKNKFCDVLIELDSGEGFRAHSCVLAAASPVLSSFLQDINLSSLAKIQISSLSLDGLQNLLHFIYVGTFFDTEVNIDELYDTAKRLNITCLASFCDELLNDCETKQITDSDSNHDDYFNGETINSEPEQSTATINIFQDHIQPTIESELTNSEAIQKSPLEQAFTIQPFSYQASSVPEMHETATEHYFDYITPFSANKAAESIEWKNVHGDVTKETVESEDTHLSDRNEYIKEEEYADMEYVGETGKDFIQCESNQIKDGQQQPECSDEVNAQSVDVSDAYGSHQSSVLVFDSPMDGTSQITNHAVLPAADAQLEEEMMTEMEVLLPQPDGSHASVYISVPALTIGADGSVPPSVLQEYMHHSHFSGELDISIIKPVFHCRYCPMTFHDVASYREHSIQHDNGNTFFCDLCGHSFKHKHNVKLHRKRHGEKNMKCSYCAKLFFSKHDIDLHMRSHTGEKPFKCNFCDKSFTQSSNMLSHKRSVHNDVYLGGARNYACTICPKAFKTRDMLRKHTSMHTRTVTCLLCDSVCRTRKQLQKHMKDVHDVTDFVPSKEEGTIEIFQCMMCNRSFLSQKKLEFHRELVHVKARRFKCPHEKCEYEAYFKCHIERHIKTHDRGLQRKLLAGTVHQMAMCECCGVQFTTKKLLAKHKCLKREKVEFRETEETQVIDGAETAMKVNQFSDYDPETTDQSVKEDDHDDDIKAKTYRGQRLRPALRMYVTESTDAEGRVQYTCNQCSAVLHTPKGVEKHLSVHDANREVFNCDSCDKSFYQRAHLKRHWQMTHNKKRRYQCMEKACLYTCYYLSQMVQHYQFKHKNCPVPSEVELKIACFDEPSEVELKIASFDDNNSQS